MHTVFIQICILLLLLILVPHCTVNINSINFISHIHRFEIIISFSYYFPQHLATYEYFLNFTLYFWKLFCVESLAVLLSDRLTFLVKFHCLFFLVNNLFVLFCHLIITTDNNYKFILSSSPIISCKHLNKIRL